MGFIPLQSHELRRDLPHFHSIPGSGHLRFAVNRATSCASNLQAFFPILICGWISAALLRSPRSFSRQVIPVWTGPRLAEAPPRRDAAEDEEPVFRHLRFEMCLSMLLLVTQKLGSSV